MHGSVALKLGSVGIYKLVGLTTSTFAAQWKGTIHVEVPLSWTEWKATNMERPWLAKTVY